MDNEPKLCNWLEPHAHPDLSQQEIKDVVNSPNCVNLQIDPTTAMRPMRRAKLLLTKKQKDNIALEWRRLK